MDADQWAYRQAATNEHVICVDDNDLAPYLLPEPVPTVPRAAVQTAVDMLRDMAVRAMDHPEETNPQATASMRHACRVVMGHTGVTPAEVHLEPCGQCGGTGRISYNPNLNPNAFPAVTTAKCGKCGGTGVTPSEETS